MQLAHVTSTQYVPLNLPNFALLTTFMANSWAHRWGYGLVDEYSLLVMLAVASAWSYCYMAYVLVNEFASELGIPIFAVPRRLASLIYGAEQGLYIPPSAAKVLTLASKHISIYLQSTTDSLKLLVGKACISA